MSFWFKTYREHSDDPQNSMLAEIYRLLLQTRSEVTSSDTGSSDLEKKRVEVIPTESYIIIITGACFVKGEGRPVSVDHIYYTGREPDTAICNCMVDFNYRENQLADRSVAGNNMLLKGLPKIVSYQPEYPPSSIKLDGLTSHVDMGNTSNLKLGEEYDGPTLLFDGVNDQVNCGNETSLWSQALTKFSFSFWVYPTAGHDGINRLLIRHGNTAHGFECNIDHTINGQVYFQVRDSLNAVFEANNGTTGQRLVLNKWNHIICSYNSTLGSANVRIYVNGELGSQTANLTETLNLSATMEISGPSTDLQGYVKDFKWWTNNAVALPDAVKMYEDTYTIAPNYWLKMDEGTGNPVDNISGTLTGTLQGGTVWSTASNPPSSTESEISTAYWLYFPTNPSSDAYIVSRGGRPSHTAYVDSSGLIKAKFYYANGIDATLNSGITGTGAWHRVIHTHSTLSNISKLYVDGVLTASNPTVHPLRNSATTNSGRFMLGAKPTPFTDFDGYTDRIDLGAETSLWSQSLTKFSFFIRFYATASYDSGWRNIIAIGDSVDEIGIGYAGSPTGTLNYWVSKDGYATQASVDTNITDQLGRWYSVLCTYDSTLGSNNAKMYINGNFTAQDTYAFTINMSAVAKMFLGSYEFDAQPSNFNFQGGQYDFRWWTGTALTSSDVLKVHNNDPTAPAPNYWLKMDEGTGNPIDSISGTKVGTMVDSTSWDSFASSFLQCNIKNVKVWRREISDAEALDDYNGNYVSPAGLVSEWDFDEDDFEDKAVDSQSYNTGIIYDGVFDKNQLPFSLTEPYPYVDGVINELIGYRTTGDEYLIIPELSDDFRITGITTGGYVYEWVVKLSTFDKFNGQYMKLLQKADDFTANYFQSVQIRDDGKIYIMYKFNGVSKYLRSVYPLKLNKLYRIALGIRFTEVSANIYELFTVYLNGFPIGMEVTTAANDYPDVTDINDFHTYVLTGHTPGIGNYVGQIYSFRSWLEQPDNNNMLSLATNKFTTRQIDRGHVLVSNLTKLAETNKDRENIFTLASSQITDLFEYFLSDTVPTARFTNDEGIAIEDEFEYTLTTVIKFHSLDLNGSTAYVEIPVIDPVRKHFSISVWVKYQGNSGGWGGVISRIDGMPNGNRLLLQSTKIRWHAKYGDASDPFRDYIATVSDISNAWHHIAMTYDGDDDERIKLFLDGHKVLDKHQEGQIKGGDDGDNGKTYIGKGRDDGYYLDGYLDRLVIYDKTLSESEVRKLATKQEVRTGIMAKYSFEQNFSDSSDDGDFDGKGRGGATFTTDVP